VTYDEWVEKYQPEQNMIVMGDRGFENTLFETYGPELDYVQTIRGRAPARIWTLLEEDGRQWISSSYHYINRIGYFITGVPLRDDLLIIELDSDEED
jgi:hypothetical protein